MVINAPPTTHIAPSIRPTRVIKCGQWLSINSLNRSRSATLHREPIAPDTLAFGLPPGRVYR
jgi:hypothetical protein